MPHVTLEYSANIPDDRLDVPAFFERLHAALVEVGYGLEDIKSRAHRCEVYRVGAGLRGRAFAHLTLMVLDRRPVDVQRAAGEAALALLAEAFHDALERLDGDVTVEVREARVATYFKARTAGP